MGRLISGVAYIRGWLIFMVAYIWGRVSIRGMAYSRGGLYPGVAYIWGSVSIRGMAYIRGACNLSVLLYMSDRKVLLQPIALISSSRYLLRRGDLMYVQVGEKGKKGKVKVKPTLKPTYLFLFSDLVLIAKKKRYRTA